MQRLTLPLKLGFIQKCVVVVVVVVVVVGVMLV